MHRQNNFYCDLFPNECTDDLPCPPPPSPCNLSLCHDQQTVATPLFSASHRSMTTSAPHPSCYHSNHHTVIAPYLLCWFYASPMLVRFPLLYQSSQLLRVSPTLPTLLICVTASFLSFHPWLSHHVQLVLQFRFSHYCYSRNRPCYTPVNVTCKTIVIP